MPDSDKPLRQAVQQEPSDELHGADGDRLGAVFLSVFGAKGYHAVVKGLVKGSTNLRCLSGVRDLSLLENREIEVSPFYCLLDPG